MIKPESDWISLATKNPAFVTYQLEINLVYENNITIGRLGNFDFLAGRYIYTGSARRYLTSRIKRHLSKDKKLRWHIDYLLAVEDAEVKAIKLHEKSECACNQAVAGVILAAGFGASDCRARCGSHLKYIDKG